MNRTGGQTPSDEVFVREITRTASRSRHRHLAMYDRGFVRPLLPLLILHSRYSRSAHWQHKLIGSRWGGGTLGTGRELIYTEPSCNFVEAVVFALLTTRWLNRCIDHWAVQTLAQLRFLYESVVTIFFFF